MTHRPLLWLSALGVALGAVAAVPSPAGAQTAGWTITIETEAVAPSHVVEVAGDVKIGLIGALKAESATVTLVPRVELPEACGTEPVTRTVDVVDGRYEADLPVACNGPYQVQVVAKAELGGTSGEPKKLDIGVAAAPAPPAPPRGVGTADGVEVSWGGSPYPDAVGWVLYTATGPKAFRVGTTETVLGPELRTSTLALEAVHWGAEGPEGPTVVSGPSTFVGSAAYNGKNNQPTPPTTPQRPTIPQTPGGGGGGGGATVPSGSTTPPSTSGPSRGTGSPQTLPEGFSEELPFGTRPEAFVPGTDTASADVPDDGEQVAGAPAPTGLVRTTQKTSPGLVAPFALALLMLTVAAHIAWFLRRSRPSGGGGQVRPA